MILFGINMLECRVEFYDRAVDRVMSESTSDIVHRALQHLQFFTLCLVFKQFELFGRRCRDQITAANANAAQGILPAIAHTQH